MSKYGQPETPDEKKEIAEYWQERAEQDRKLKKEKKRARDRRSSKVYYVKSTKEAAEAHRLAWHEARARKKTEREQQRLQAERSPLFKALGLTTPEEQKVFLKIQEIFPAKLVSLAVQGGFVNSAQAEPLLAYLSGPNAKLIR